MYKIGLVGTESTHCEAFCRLINQNNVIDAKFTHVWGEPGFDERTTYVMDTYGIKTRCKNIEDMIGEVDLAFIVTRDGNAHFAQAMPFIESKTPIWIDKPIALNEEDAKKLCDYAKKYDAALLGGSTLKSASEILKLKDDISKLEKSVEYFSLSAFANLNNPYGGIAFHGIHHVEILNFLFGDDIDTLIANVYNGNVNVILNYKNGMIANLVMLCRASKYSYSVVAGAENLTTCVTLSDAYEKEMHYVEDVIKGSAQPRLASDFIAPVKIMNAIEEAIASPGSYIKYNK